MQNKIILYRQKLGEAYKKNDFQTILKHSLAIIHLLPNDYQALLNIAKVYIVGGKEGTAIKVLTKLIKLYGEKDWDIMYNLARAKFQDLKTLGDTKPVQRLLKLPNLTVEKKLAIYDLLNRHYLMTGDVGLNLKYCKLCIKLCPDKDRKCNEYTNFLFNLHYLHNIKPEHLYKNHMAFNNFFSTLSTYKHRKDAQKGKIRIGYISPDFHRHAVVLFVYAMLHKYDTKYFEVFCYAKCEEDQISEQIKGFVDQWCNIKDMTTIETAKKIYEDKIDILFDLAGHTKANSLAVLAHKPAPIQLCGIGYFDTTGLKTVDYFLTDEFCDNPGKNDKYFTENLLYLPYSHFCYTAVDIPWKPQPAPCLTNKYITFGSMNFFTKINSVVARTWQNILDQVPNARLLLKDRTVTTPIALEKIKNRWQKAGLDISRIDFEPWTADYLKDYYKIDIALDTFPYPGGATTCDALYMGVPVITLMGKRHGARFGFSLLSNVGSMDDCIAFSLEDYVAKATLLARNKRRINFFHMFLREHMELSPLMNGYLYMQTLERKYFSIWEKYSNKKIEHSFEENWHYAKIYFQTCQYEKELTILQEIINYAPDKNKLYKEMANCCIKLGWPQQASHYYLQAVCSTEDFAKQVSAYSSYLLSLLYYEKSNKKLIKEHEDYQQFFSKIKRFKPLPNKSTKIRIAYISADFRKHVMYYFYQSLLTAYDKNRFEVICYCLNPKDDKTALLKEHVDEWYNVQNQSYEKIAKSIYENKIDILFDMSGHTVNNALPILAYRPASVQISGLGYLGPIGLSTVDYYLTDKYSYAPSKCSTEQIQPLKLKHHSQFCYKRNNVPPIFSKAPCRQAGIITFASFNSYIKITDEMLIVWNSILTQVPNSIIILKNQSFISLDVRKTCRKRLRKLGLQEKRFYLEAADSIYMQRYLDIDIALDTFPYNGGGTTCDALYMGVPVISLYGETQISRMGRSILTTINLPELAVDNPQEYINKAISLAMNKVLLDKLHENLYKMIKASPLMDEKGYINELENIYSHLINKIAKKI
ncbi:hypothetical protein [Pectinatus cerevisiiphilus]|uniref:Glycosyl transferase family 41 n=1 Tax=Pectinatus cerevisiiphilus TaxID=86956 RepID=A0A4R3K9Q1_9FIRM|nr:hypothetical protein [Pectinatus cerevisiiphilus]TCS79629.1 glycosyl transferase family 41 [Pectinatus cerevisiiphilus]